MVSWGNLGVSSLAACIILLGLFLGLFKFYSKLSTYHRPFHEYQAKIAVKGVDEVPNEVRDEVPTSLLHQEHTEDPYVPKSELGENSTPPEIVVDYKKRKVQIRGENSFDKFRWLWFFSSASVAVGTFVFTFYGAVFHQLSLDFTLPEGEWLFGIVILMSILNFVVRVGSFLTFSLVENEIKDQLRLDLHNFMFSFIMSAAVLVVVFLFIPISSGEELLAQVSFSESSAKIVAAMVVAPCFLSAISEVALHLCHVPDYLKSHNIQNDYSF